MNNFHRKYFEKYEVSSFPTPSTPTFFFSFYFFLVFFIYLFILFFFLPRGEWVSIFGPKIWESEE